MQLDATSCLTSDPAMAKDIQSSRRAAKRGASDRELEAWRVRLETTELALPDAISLSRLLADLGDVSAAERVLKTSVARCKRISNTTALAPKDLLNAAQNLVEIDAMEHAETLCRLAHDAAPNDEATLTPLLTLLLQQNRSDEARALTEAFCQNVEDRFEVLHYLAMFFSNFDEAETVTRLLDLAESRSKTKEQQAKLDYLRAATGDAIGSLDQHSMAIGVFDNFADSYEEKLKLLGNNGPDLIREALKQIGLPKNRSRRVLDAGCGTGLCAKFLRPYAKHIMGVDISVAMLEKARAKRSYNELARTDLSIRATFPEGQYDLVICADVLVYFGSLDTVFANFHDVMRPGGTLLFTVEDESNPEFQSGFKLYPSGRHKHGQTYLVNALTRAGFPKPKLLERARLRNEMGQPIHGTVVAVQKPALSFG